MKVTQYDNLVQFTRLIAFNSYLVLEEDSITVVDTNLPGSAKGILKAAAQFNRPIRRIVLTHLDDDHVGSLDALREQLPDAEVIVSARSALRMAGNTGLLPGEPEGKLVNPYKGKTQATRTVSEGDRVGSLEVIAAPGHTPGHIALWDTRDGTLIAGDALCTQFKTFVTGVLVLRFPFLFTWHKPTALATAKKLRALNPKRLAVGHGRVLENPLAEMDKAIREAESSFGRHSSELVTHSEGG